MVFTTWEYCTDAQGPGNAKFQDGDYNPCALCCAYYIKKKRKKGDRYGFMQPTGTRRNKKITLYASIR